MSRSVRVADLEVVAPNFKRRLSGVTSTIKQLVPTQRAAGLQIAVFGPGLPDSLARLRWYDLWRLWQRPRARPFRIWHARRNVEMVGGIVLRDVLRMPVRLVFTSASQRPHKRFTKWLIARMDRVIATSTKTASYLEVPNTVVMHGIDVERFSPPADRSEARAAVGMARGQRLAGCFGRVRHQKGTDLFLHAMISVLRDNPDWAAVIAGRVTEAHHGYERELRAMAEASGVADRVHFVGEHSDIERWYKALDLFVAPQRWEGFGLTPLEAMACGVPVVATDVGAFSDLIVQGETGFVLPDLDAATMELRIRSLVEDDMARDRMGKASRAHAAGVFPLEREARQIAEVYEGLWRDETV